MRFIKTKIFSCGTRFELAEGFSQQALPHGEVACTFIAHAMINFGLKNILSEDTMSANKFIELIRSGVDNHADFCRSKSDCFGSRFNYKKPGDAATYYPDLQLLMIERNGKAVTPQVKHTTISQHHSQIDDIFCGNSQHLQCLTFKLEYQDLDASQTSARSASPLLNTSDASWFSGASLFHRARRQKFCDFYYDPTSRAFVAIQASDINGLRLQNQNVGYLLGANKHTIAVVQQGADYWLFNSLSDNAFGANLKAAYILRFAGATAREELIRYLKETLWSPRRGCFSRGQLTVDVRPYALKECPSYGTM